MGKETIRLLWNDDGGIFGERWQFFLTKKEGGRGRKAGSVGISKRTG
jgi:hypothetical protein